MKRLAHGPALALTLTVGGIGISGCVGGPPAPAPLNPVRFVAVGNITGADTASDGTGGLARVATARARIANEGRVLLVAAGDVLLNGTGAAPGGLVDVLHAAKLDYATLGTGELALPFDTLTSRLAASHFKWLSANCVAQHAPGNAPLPQVVPWDTVRIANHKVGVFGLTAGGRYAAAGAGDASPAVLCNAPDSAARRAADTLTAQGADLIVAITHQPLAADRELLLDESRLDLILRGAAGDSAQDVIIGGRHVVTAAGTRTAQFVTLWGGKGQWREAVGRVLVDTRFPPDTAVMRAAKQIPAGR